MRARTTLKTLEDLKRVVAEGNYVKYSTPFPFLITSVDSHPTRIELRGRKVFFHPLGLKEVLDADLADIESLGIEELSFVEAVAYGVERKGMLDRWVKNYEKMLEKEYNRKAQHELDCFKPELQFWTNFLDKHLGETIVMRWWQVAGVILTA